MMPGSSSSSSNSSADSQTSTPEMMELKRKVDMLTEQLSLNRRRHSKRPRISTASRGQVVIEIPEFPMEFYLIADQARGRTKITPQNWFENFNESLKIRRQPDAYHNWIQTRTVDLLPKVLDVIVNNLKRHRHKITGKDILSCRLVNKAWKNSIDKFLQDSVPVDLPVFNRQKKLITVATCIDSDKYKSVAEMLYYLEKNKDLQTLTPFPSGRLCIQYSAGMENQYEVAFNNGISTLLEFYGKNLQAFSFFDGRPELGIALVSSWIKKMPNLKSLHIESTKISQNRRGLLIPKKDFPHLEKLITVHICSTIGASPKLTELVLSVNPQIRNLKFDSFQPQWCKLKQVSLTSLSIRMKPVTDLQPLAALRFPLQKLRLTSNTLKGEGIDLGEVLQLLQRYEVTLKELILDLDKDKVKDNSENWSLKLPCLEYLYLCLRRPALEKKPYDFLLPLESLEVLEIHLVAGEAHSKTDLSEVIQLNGYFERLYESNVWNLFPKLKKVDIKGIFGGSTSSRHIIYTREKLPERRNGNDC